MASPASLTRRDSSLRVLGVMRGRNLIHFLFLWLACGLPVEGALLRGPFLQQGTSSSILVSWRTSNSGASVVRYGLSPGNLAFSASGPTATDHKILLSGLQPRTTYYYSVETAGSILADGTSLRFITPPPQGSRSPLRVWVLGDCGTGTAEQAAVRDAFYQFYQNRPADGVVLLGDNAYFSGTDSEYQVNFFDVYQQILKQVPVWPCYGNHETYGDLFPDGTYAYDSIFAIPSQGQCGGPPSGSSRYYSWNLGNIHFIMLDSMTSDRLSTGAMAQWLSADLQNNPLPWVVACFHHPPYTKGSHDSDFEPESIDMREQILPILEGHGVDLVLCGHSHAYERSALIDGHYGHSTTIHPSHFKDAGDGREDGDGAYHKAEEHASAHEGAVHMVAGSAGQHSGGAMNHPVMKVSLDQLGSVVLDVTDNRMDVLFLRELPPGGQPFSEDHFTILKGALSAPVQPGPPSIVAVSPDSGVAHWEDLSDNESAFRAELSKDGGPFALVGEFSPGRMWCDLSGLAAGSQYVLRVTALNARGESPSALLNFGWSAAPPSIPALEVERFRHFGLTGSAGAAADMLDPDHDVCPTLLELAVGSDPRDSDSRAVVNPARDEFGLFTVSFHRRAIPELIYQIQFCQDPSNGTWSTLFQSTGSSNQEGVVVVTDPEGPGSPRRFARLAVSRAQ